MSRPRRSLADVPGARLRRWAELEELGRHDADPAVRAITRLGLIAREELARREERKSTAGRPGGHRGSYPRPASPPAAPPVASGGHHAGMD